jgi:hypothetical protein
MPTSVLQIIKGDEVLREVGDQLHRALLEGRLLLRSNMALQAEVSESHLDFEEARWQLRETMAMIRERRQDAGDSVQTWSSHAVDANSSRRQHRGWSLVPPIRQADQFQHVSGQTTLVAHMNKQKNRFVTQINVDIQLGFADTQIEAGGQGLIMATPCNPMHGLDFVWPCVPQAIAKGRAPAERGD